MSFKDELEQIAKESDKRELNKDELKVVEEMKKAMKQFVAIKGKLTSRPVELAVDVHNVSFSQLNEKVIVKYFEDEELRIQNLSITLYSRILFSSNSVRVLFTVIL